MKEHRHEDVTPEKNIRQNLFSSEGKGGRIREVFSVFVPDLIPVVVSSGDGMSHKSINAWLSPQLTVLLKRVGPKNSTRR
ncbi:MAG: hypothetical protein HY299_14610 [Verrucomicrobia bacterium]|nr:hypothetical protein [Verrucomicrobiota bacterium]